MDGARGVRSEEARLVLLVTVLVGVVLEFLFDGGGGLGVRALKHAQCLPVGCVGDRVERIEVITRVLLCGLCLRRLTHLNHRQYPLRAHAVLVLGVDEVRALERLHLLGRVLRYKILVAVRLVYSVLVEDARLGGAGVVLCGLQFIGRAGGYVATTAPDTGGVARTDGLVVQLRKDQRHTRRHQLVLHRHLLALLLLDLGVGGGVRVVRDRGVAVVLGGNVREPEIE